MVRRLLTCALALALLWLVGCASTSTSTGERPADAELPAFPPLTFDPLD